MAVYNGERFLSEAIDSVLNQTYSHFEFIIVDDGSTDTTPQILADYAQQDARIRVVTQENAGPGAARNVALSSARGVYIAIVDADDVCLASRFEKQMDFLQAHPEVGLLTTSIYITDENLRPYEAKVPPSGSSLLKWQLFFYTALYQPPCMMRKNIAEEVGFYRGEFSPCEDFDLFNRMKFLTQYAAIPEPLYYYRQWGGNISAEKIHLLEDIMARSIKDFLTDMLGRPIEQQEAAAFQALSAHTTGSARPTKLDDMRQTAALLMEVYSEFCQREQPSDDEAREIRLDVALKMMLLGTLAVRQSPGAASGFIWQAIKLDPRVLLSSMLRGLGRLRR